MFSLTFREGVIVLSIVAAVVLGMGVKHWRDGQREHPVPAQAGPAPAPR